MTKVLPWALTVGPYCEGNGSVPLTKMACIFIFLPTRDSKAAASVVASPTYAPHNFVEDALAGEGVGVGVSVGAGEETVTGAGVGVSIGAGEETGTGAGVGGGVGVGAEHAIMFTF